MQRMRKFKQAPQMTRKTKRAPWANAKKPSNATRPKSLPYKSVAFYEKNVKAAGRNAHKARQLKADSERKTSRLLKKLKRKERETKNEKTRLEHEMVELRILEDILEIVRNIKKVSNAMRITFRSYRN